MNQHIQSDVFEASGHKWRLDLYPNGNEEENDHISLYLVICDIESLDKDWKVCVDINFYIYDHLTHNYASFQGVDGNMVRFHEKKMKWGFDRLISLESFKDTNNGYLCNDSCVFGAEVFKVPAYSQKDRCLTLIKPPAAINTYTWRIENFSVVTDQVLLSEDFKVGKVMWNLSLYPKGSGTEGTLLSIYLRVNETYFQPDDWRIYAKFKFRVKNQRTCHHKELETDHWFYDKYPSIGFPKFMLLKRLSDPANGFLLNDIIIVEAEISSVGTFKNFI